MNRSRTSRTRDAERFAGSSRALDAEVEEALGVAMADLPAVVFADRRCLDEVGPVFDQLPRIIAREHDAVDPDLVDRREERGVEPVAAARVPEARAEVVARLALDVHAMRPGHPRLVEVEVDAV